MVSRRQLLAAGGLASAGLAGCLDSLSDGSSPEPEPAETPPTPEYDSPAPVSVADAAPVDAESPLVTVAAEGSPAGTPDGETERLLATYGDVAELGVPAIDETQQTHYVSVVFETAAADAFADQLADLGALESPGDYDLGVVFPDGETAEYDLAPSLAQAMAAGDWDGRFRLQGDDEAAMEAVVDAFDREQ